MAGIQIWRWALEWEHMDWMRWLNWPLIDHVILYGFPSIVLRPHCFRSEKERVISIFFRRNYQTMRATWRVNSFRQYLTTVPVDTKRLYLHFGTTIYEIICNAIIFQRTQKTTCGALKRALNTNNYHLQMETKYGESKNGRLGNHAPVLCLPVEPRGINLRIPHKSLHADVSMLLGLKHTFRFRTYTCSNLVCV